MGFKRITKAAEPEVVKPISGQNRRVRRNGQPPPEYRAPAEPLYQPYDGPALQEPGSPPRTLIERVDQLHQSDRAEAEELLLSTLHQFVLAKTPVDTICQRMGINLASYKWLREKLRRKIREQVKGRDPYDFIAPMIAEMEEVKATAWREVAVAPAKEWSRRMRALEVIMKAQGDMGRLLQLGGLFDNSPMRAPLTNDDEDSGGANVLKDLARHFLEGGYAEPSAKIIVGDA